MDFSNFHFLRPWWLLACIPLVALLWLVARRKLGARVWESVIDPQLRPHVLIGQASKKTQWPVFVIGLSGMLAIIALAGPTWDRLPQPVYRTQSAMVIALDLSRSMDSTDVKPSRLARARFKIADILNQRKEGQTALVVYAGLAYTVSPLTSDTATIGSQLPALTTDLMPSHGSRADLAMNKAVELLKQAGLSQGEILLITDGAQIKQSMEAVKELRKDGYTLSILGVGTNEGAPIPLRSGGFVNDASGAIVVSELEADALRDLAHAGDGIYRTLSVNDDDIRALLAFARVDRLEKEVEQTMLKADLWREEGPWLLLMLLPLVALAFRRGYLCVTVVLLAPFPQAGHAVDWASLWSRPDQQASQALQQGDAARAAELFEQPAWKGAAHYRAGQYEHSIQSLEGLGTAQAFYNKGNALARLGRYPEAIAAYEEALKLDSEHGDARYNRDLVQQQLQNQQQSSQQNQDGQSQEGEQGSSETQSSQDQDTNQQAQAGSESETDSQKPENTEASDAGTPRKSSQGAMPEPPQRHADTEDRAADPDASAELSPPQETNAAAVPRSHTQDQTPDESQQATEQWLRRIPDDPGGLLRRKFYYQYQRQPQAKRDEAQPW